MTGADGAVSAASPHGGNWVRDRNLMPLEPAVRKLTGVQADILGFKDRGYLRPNAWADIVVFDPAQSRPAPPDGCAISQPVRSGSLPTRRSVSATWWSTA